MQERLERWKILSPIPINLAASQLDLFVLGSLEFISSFTVVTSQLVCLWPIEIFNFLGHIALDTTVNGLPVNKLCQPYKVRFFNTVVFQYGNDDNAKTCAEPQKNLVFSTRILCVMMVQLFHTIYREKLRNKSIITIDDYKNKIITLRVIK